MRGCLTDTTESFDSPRGSLQSESQHCPSRGNSRANHIKESMPVGTTAGSSRVMVGTVRGFYSQQRGFVASRIHFSLRFCNKRPKKSRRREFSRCFSSHRYKGHAQSSTESRSPQPVTKDENHRSPSFRAATTVATQSPEPQHQDRWANMGGSQEQRGLRKRTQCTKSHEKCVRTIHGILTWTADQRHATQLASLVPRYRQVVCTVA